uniref:Uncharacterized protein n=1 Tax=Arundo donax TaxID=35708 RepID=A0A0A8ZRG1_ARUDO
MVRSPYHLITIQVVGPIGGLLRSPGASAAVSEDPMLWQDRAPYSVYAMASNDLG